MTKAGIQVQAILQSVVATDSRKQSRLELRSNTQFAPSAR